MNTKSLTQGSVTKSMLIFAAPMIAGNMLQQCYNLADAWIVGRFIGADALGAVGAAYTLMTFFTSIIIGLCMGSGALISYSYGKKEYELMKTRFHTAFAFIGGVSVIITVLIIAFLKPVLLLLQTPLQLMPMLQSYCAIVFCGIIFVFLYNYFAFLLRSVGQSVPPLIFLGVSAVLNIGLDLLFVITFKQGVGGAALATVISQAICGVGLAVYTLIKSPELRLRARYFRFDKAQTKQVIYYSCTACVQQSVMNFGILMVQGLVNSFGAAAMAAFAAAVKIDTLAYMPAQEFSNAYSLFVSQNYGAAQHGRIKRGSKSAAAVSLGFCAFISLFVFVFAKELMQIFISPAETQIIQIGVQYLRIEGSFYAGIGLLFLLYAYYRGTGRPEMSLLLTIISLGTRVVLAYILAPIPAIGLTGIWCAVPIGWVLADIVGVLYLKRAKKL